MLVENVFIDGVKDWLKNNENSGDVVDDVHPEDSISNVHSKCSHQKSTHSHSSSKSGHTIASAYIKAEATWTWCWDSCMYSKTGSFTDCFRMFSWIQSIIRWNEFIPAKAKKTKKLQIHMNPWPHPWAAMSQTNLTVCHKDSSACNTHWGVFKAEEEEALGQNYLPKRKKDLFWLPV